MTIVISEIDLYQRKTLEGYYICKVKFILAITIFLAMLVQTFSKAFVMADFYLNRATIAQQLCENKDKPQLKCKGNCALKKELERENKKEIPQQLQEVKTFLKAERFTIDPASLHSLKAYGIVLNDNRICKKSTSVFRPPGV